MTEEATQHFSEYINQVDEGMRMNISAYRILFIYMLLCQSEQVTSVDLNTHFLNHPLIQRTFTNETLSKYLYTLKLFGCVIHRIDKQGQVIYKMDEHPLKMDISIPEIQSLKDISDFLALHPLTEKHKKFSRLVKRIIKAPHSESYKVISGNTIDGLSIDSSLTQQNYQKIEQFQKYCSEGQVLEISYEKYPTQSLLTMVEPHEVIYDKKSLYLLGNDPTTNKKVRYQIDKIQSHRQLPFLSRSQILKTTVIFKLTGRVAMNYRPYPGEIICNKGEFLLIKHKTDEVEQLLKRLLKYGHHCQVISPNSTRQEMLALIDRLLEASEDPSLDTFLNTVQTDGNLHKWACYLDSQQTSDDAMVD